MRPRLGTPATQGINAEAAALQRAAAAAGVARFIGSDEPCPYPRHRGLDWRLKTGGPVACGVCHPPAAGLDVLRWDEHGQLV